LPVTAGKNNAPATSTVAERFLLGPPTDIEQRPHPSLRRV
jgi:hypothetical protein